jgi:hypothetical protein
LIVARRFNAGYGDHCPTPSCKACPERSRRGRLKSLPGVVKKHVLPPRQRNGIPVVSPQQIPPLKLNDLFKCFHRKIRFYRKFGRGLFTVYHGPDGVYFRGRGQSDAKEICRQENNGEKRVE